MNKAKYKVVDHWVFHPSIAERKHMCSFCGSSDHADFVVKGSEAACCVHCAMAFFLRLACVTKTLH